jgi:hypothetical protein
MTTKLITEKLEYFVVNCYGLELLIKEVYGLEDFNLRESQEWYSADSEYSFKNINGTLTAGDKEDIEALVKGTQESFPYASVFLNDLVSKGHIEPGNYLIFTD